MYVSDNCNVVTSGKAETRSLQPSYLCLCTSKSVAYILLQQTVMKHSRAKSRDDIMALMHVTYTGEDALPLQQNTEM